MLLFIVLSIPAVQTYVANKVTDNLNETYGTQISIDKIGVNWKGEVDIRKVLIMDHRDDTLIFSQELQTNILNFRNLINGDLGFGDIKLQDAYLNVITYEGEETDNLTIFSNKFDTGQKPTKPFSLIGNDLQMNNGRVRFRNYNLSKPEVIDFHDVNLTAEDFEILGPDISAQIQSLSLDGFDGLNVTDLRADFSYTPEAMVFNDLVLKTDNSNIQGNLRFDYAEKGMADFENDVTITATFEDAVVATKDLNNFYDEFGEYQEIKLSGNLKGTLNDFQLENADISFDSSRLAGDFTFENLLDAEKDFRIASPNHSIRTDYYDLRRFMPRILGDVLPAELKPLGSVSFQGNSTITSFELSTNSVIQTSAGRIKADLDLGNITDFDNAFYDGQLVLTQFNMGKMLNTSSLGTITADVMVDGRGFTQKTVSSRLEGTISSFTFEGYKYTNIEVSGTLKDPVFNGELSIDDPNLKLDFTGLVDVSKDFNQYDFEADVEYAELNQLNLIKRDSVSVFAGRIRVDMDGTTIDDAVGTISFNETFYQTASEDYFFDDFQITSTFEGDVRTIEINSPDIITGKIEGEFLIRDIPYLFQNGIGSIYANYIPQEVTTDQYIDYEFEVYNKIVDVFVPQLKLGENTRVKGSVSSDQSKFQLNFRSPELLLYDNYLGKVNIQIDNDNPLYNTYINIDSVYTGFYNLKDVNVINKTLNDTLYVRSEFAGGKEKNDVYNLSLYHTINPEGKSVVGFKKSDILYKDNTWYINEENNNLNKVVFDDNFKTIRIDSLVLNHNEEFIRLAGELRDSTYKDLKLRFTDVNIGNITPEVDSLRLYGNMNGSLDFLQKNGAYYPNSEITIDDIVINDIEFGDLDLKVKGNEDLSAYSINTELVKEGVTSISAVGGIDVAPQNPTIDLGVRLNEFNLQALSPFGGEVITNIRGLISGRADVTGNYKSPDIDGSFQMEKAGLTVPYLNVDYLLEDGTTLRANKNSLAIESTKITDTKYDTEGTFSGTAYHQNFQDWRLDLDIGSDYLLVLDTPPEEDALYYGTGFIDGTAEIDGPVDELVIDVIATTAENTNFKIPLSDVASIGDDSFIYFLSPQEKEARISGEVVQTEDVKGLTLNFELDITEDAEVEVVVDQENNSTLTGSGVGTLLIEINTLGKFKMWGDFLVIEGIFDFRYGGFIQKNIGVVPGGSINWDGNPARAQLDLTAKYQTQANPSILLDNPTFNRQIPVEVLVDLTGELIQPNINFRIDFPRVSSIVKSELEYKLQNQDQRERQALFLIASGDFISDTYAGADAFATGTLVERVSGLVNELFASEDSKFAVGLDYQTGIRTPNQETADRFGVTLSTRINERILINGKVGVPVGGVSETAVAGDIEVQWLVNEDGSLRMKFFNRQADIQFIGEDQIFEQGAGISYSVDFDTFKELVDKLFGTKISLESEADPVSPTDNENTPVDFNSEALREEN
ncbi:translocation/assembly module TamB domain-containing protein [Flavobacteriaceae bacterium TK19130]|nr:translocation/assembly module TamB domain-containing protein [Thermobacterium salinum]